MSDGDDTQGLVVSGFVDDAVDPDTVGARVGHHAGGTSYATACLLALNGLRVSEVCVIAIEDLAQERSHQVVTIRGKGDKPATIPPSTEHGAIPSDARCLARPTDRGPEEWMWPQAIAAVTARGRVDAQRASIGWMRVRT